MAMQAGVGEDDVFRIMMSMGQTGMGRGRGGAGVRRMIEYLLGAATLTGHLSAAQHLAMGAGLPGRPGLNLLGPDGRLRGEFEDKHGNLLLGKVLAFLESERTHFRPADFANDLTNAFLQQGGLVAGTLLLPQAYAQTQRNWAMVQHQLNIEGMWKRYSNTLSFAVPQFVTNFKNVLAEMFNPALPVATSALKSAATELGIFSQYLEKNQGIAMNWVKGITGITVWASARWLIPTLAAWARLPASMGALASSANLMTRSLLADAALLRGGAVVGGPGGVMPVGVGGAAAAEEGGFMRSLRGLDHFFFGGLVQFLGQLLIAGFGKFGALVRGIGARLIVDPLLWIGLKIEGFGTFLAASEKPIVGVLGRLITGIGRFSWSAGEFADGVIGVFSRLAGPLSWLLSLSGSSPGVDASYQEALREARARDPLRVHGGGIQGAGFRGLPAARTIHMQGVTVNFNLPPGTPKAMGRAAFMHFLNLTGSIATSPYLPSPVTVAGAAFGGSR